MEKHLIASIGDHCYVALAKGALVPEHVLVLPIAHRQSLVALTPHEHREMLHYVLALRDMMAKRGGGQSIVVFERNYKTSHCQIQVVPIPADASSDDEVKRIVEEEAESEGLDADSFQVLACADDLRLMLREQQPYFSLDLPSASERLLFRKFSNHEKGGRLPLNFGRQVLCKLLKLPDDRIDWRECVIGKEEESEQCKAFRLAFRPFDFTL